MYFIRNLIIKFVMRKLTLLCLADEHATYQRCLPHFKDKYAIIHFFSSSLSCLLIPGILPIILLYRKYYVPIVCFLTSKISSLSFISSHIFSYTPNVILTHHCLDISDTLGPWKSPVKH